MRDTIRLRLKAPSKPSKQKLRHEQTVGDDFCRKSGQWNKLKRLIDKDQNLYWEVITDTETGEVIHECKEPLTGHQGHGSAKKKKTNPP